MLLFFYIVKLFMFYKFKLYALAESVMFHMTLYSPRRWL